MRLTGAVYKIPDHVYAAKIFVVCGSPEYYSDYMLRIHKRKEEVIKGAVGHHLRFENKKCEDVHIIWMPRFKGKTHELQAAAHETFHCAYDILHRRGMTVTKSSEEAFAYYFDYLYGELLRILRS